MPRSMICGVRVDHVEVKLPCYLVVDEHGFTSVYDTEDAVDRAVQGCNEAEETVNVLYLSEEE